MAGISRSEILRFVGRAGTLLAFGVATAFAEFGEPGTDKCTHGGTEVFRLAPETGDLVGETRYVAALRRDTLHDIACRYNIGVEEIFMANDPANIDHWAPGEGTRITVPQRFILPNAPRAGIVVNIPEMRLYFYPVRYAPVVRKAPPAPKTKGNKGKAAPPPKPVVSTTEVGEPLDKATEVITYPISMGRMDWRTPLGKARIVAKVKDPTWTPPESIRREHAAKGEILPAVVPAGPDNPLGAFAMRLSVPGYLIHGTEQNYKSFGIGMRVTHGCMRMYNEDVARLFPSVAVGTPVYLVNQPVKLGWQGGRLYMELSQPLDEDAGVPPEKDEETMTEAELAREEAKTPEQIKAEKARKNAKRSAYLEKVAMKLIEQENAKRPLLLDREALRKAFAMPTGLPVEIGKEALPVEALPGDSLPVQGTGETGQAAPSAVVDEPGGGRSDTPGPASPPDTYRDEQPADDYRPAGETATPSYDREPAAEVGPSSSAGSDTGEPGSSEADPSSGPDPYAPDQSAPATGDPGWEGSGGAHQSEGGR